MERLRKDKGLEKRYNAVKKAIHFLSHCNHPAPLTLAFLNSSCWCPPQLTGAEDGVSVSGKQFKFQISNVKLRVHKAGLAGHVSVKLKKCERRDLAIHTSPGGMPG
jgi:hypothetical protein